MFKYVYINRDNQILNINSFKRLNGGRLLTKSQLRLLRLRKIKLTSDKLKRQAKKDNMKNAKRILEKFDSWKYDIYESNKSNWTKQDDKDVNEIEKLLEKQASEQKG